MASETLSGHKRKFGEMLEGSETRENTPESVTTVIAIDDDNTGDEVPKARSPEQIEYNLPTHYGTLLCVVPTSSSTSWAPPIKGLFSPVREPMTPALPLPIKGSVASDADDQPYPSPYNTYPTNQTILDYEIAKAKARTPLIPSVESKDPTARYTSVLENDLAIATGRLARANYEKIAAEQRISDQAREIISLRGLVMRLEDDMEDDRDKESRKLHIFKKKVQEKMDAIVFFMMEHLPSGTEVQMDLFDVPAME